MAEAQSFSRSGNTRASTTRRADDSAVAPVAAGASWDAGSVAVTDGSGYCRNASAAPGLIALGVFASTGRNAGAAGAAKASIEYGVFRLDNDPIDPVTLSGLGRPCYLSGARSVCASDRGGTRSVAGAVVEIDLAWVWVRIQPEPITQSAPDSDVFNVDLAAGQALLSGPQSFDGDQRFIDGIVLLSPNGGLWKLAVSDAGVLSAASYTP